MRYNIAVKELGRQVVPAPSRVDCSCSLCRVMRAYLQEGTVPGTAASGYPLEYPDVVRSPDVVFNMDCPAIACKGRLDLNGEATWITGEETYEGWYLSCDTCMRMVLVQQFPGEEAF